MAIASNQFARQARHSTAETATPAATDGAGRRDRPDSQVATPARNATAKK